MEAVAGGVGMGDGEPKRVLTGVSLYEWCAYERGNKWSEGRGLGVLMMRMMLMMDSAHESG